VDKNPFFSVIIPTLNEEKYLTKLLKSLADQTYHDFEVILVDGKSDDKTIEVFKKFENKYPASKIIISDKRNVSYQRNIGALSSKGKYLIFFDADVGVEKTFLEEIHLAAIKKNFKLSTTYILPDSDREIDQVMLALSNLGQEIAKIINKPFMGEFNAIVEKNLFRKLNGFREDLPIHEGPDFAMRALKKNIEIVILPEPKVIMSLRRFRSEGTLKTLRKYVQINIMSILKGPITHKMFEYSMGGHAHKKRRRKVDLTKIDTYIKAIGKLQEKINKLLGE